MKFSKKISIIDTIKNRYSPVIFSDKQVEAEKLERLFEAARWAPSSFNAQPWRFIVGLKSDHKTYDLILQS